MAPSRCYFSGAYGEFFDEKLARRDAERYRRKGLGRASEGARRPRRRARSRRRVGARGRRRHGDDPDRAFRARCLADDERRALARLRDRGPAAARGARARSGRSGTSSTSPLIAMPSATPTSSCFTVSSAAIPTTSRCSRWRPRKRAAWSRSPSRPISRSAGLVRVLNLGPRLRGCDFRSYVHSERAMLTAVERQGFRLAGAERAGVWRLALLDRG